MQGIGVGSIEISVTGNQSGSNNIPHLYNTDMDASPTVTARNRFERVETGSQARDALEWLGNLSRSSNRMSTMTGRFV